MARVLSEPFYRAALSQLFLSSLAVSLSDEGFCVGVGDIVLECCCTDVSVMQSVFPVRVRETEREGGSERRREESEAGDERDIE